MYSTVPDVRDALTPGGVSDDSGTASGLRDGQISDAIREADAVIDTYIGGRYATPVAGALSGDFEPLRSWSRNIATYNATLTYRKGLELAERHPVQLRCSATMDQLKKVADGSLTLPIPGAPEDQAPGDATVVNQYSGTLFWPGDFVRRSPVDGYNRGMFGNNPDWGC